MKNKRWRFFLGISMLVIFVLAGCQAGAIGESPEFNTPTGCHKHRGRYFDPKLNQCVEAKDKHQVLVLDAYRYVNKLAEEGKVTEANYYIYFRSYRALQEAEKLWAELRTQGAQMIVLSGATPDNIVYDPQSEEESKVSTRRIWGGDGINEGCGWHQQFHPNSEVSKGSLKDLLLESVRKIEQQENRARPELRTAIFDNNECRIYSMVVRAHPETIRDFWNRHLTDIEGIRPLVSILDGSMPALGPVETFKEKD